MVSSNIYRAPQIKLKRTRIAPNTIFPNKISQTRVNPVIGKYLSVDERKLIFERKTVSSKNVFSRPGALVKVEKPGALTRQDDGSGKVNILFARVVAVEKQVAFLAKALDKEAELEKKARKEVVAVKKQVAFLAKALDKEAELEKKARKEYEKEQLQEEERGRRSVKEKNLEKGIFKTLISPVQAVAGKAQSVLGNLIKFFGILLAGWLTNQGWKAIKANAEGDIDKLKSIGVEVGKTLGVVAGIFALLNGGLFTILGIIGKITFAILSAPFKLLAKGIEALWNKVRNKPPTPSAGGGGARAVGAAGSSISQQAAESLGKTKIKTTVNAARTGGMASKLYDKLPAGVKRFNNLFQGGMRGSKQIPGLPRMSAPKPKGLAFKLGEMFGGLKNFAGKTKDFVIGGLKKVTDPLIKPLLGGAKALGNKIVGIASKIPGLNKFLKSQGINSVKNAKSVGKAGGILGSKALPFIGGLVNFMFAYDRIANGDLIGGGLEAISGLLDIGGLWPLSTALDAFLLARDFMPGIKENEEKLLGNLGLGKFVKSAEGITSKLPNLGDILNMVLGKKPEQPKAKVSPAATTPAAVTTPAATTPTEPQPTPSSSISSSPSSMPSAPGPVSGGGNTTVIYKKVGGAGRGAGDQSLKSGSATDVPLIASANPSNFYTMYSQIVYNVVN